MVEITKETWGRKGVEVIIFNGKKYLNQKHMEEQSQQSNLAVVTSQYSLELRKKRQELQDCGKNPSCRIL